MKKIKLFAMALFAMFSMSAMAQTATHEPGLYDSKPEQNGYGIEATVIGDNTYEVYYVTKRTIKPDIQTIAIVEPGVNRIMAGDSKSEAIIAHSANTSGSMTCQNWLSVAFNGISDYTYAANEEFFKVAPTASDATKTAYFNLKNDNTLSLKVKGYSSFAFLGSDNNADVNKGKYFKVEIDGNDVTAGTSTSLTIRRFALTSDAEHTIKVIGIGGSNNKFYGFSLAYPTTPSIKAVRIAGVDATISNDTIIAELPYGTTPAGALASVVVTYGGNGASYEINPLNGTVTVYNADKSQSKVYQLSITIAQNPSSEKELLDVKINGEEVELVNNAANLVVSSKTDISTIPVEFTLSAAATADFTSGNTHDFANPLVITVTAQDKSTATYTLTVTKAVKSILYIGGKTDDKVATAFEAQNWFVVARSAAKAPQTYEDYDVVVLHESIDGKLAGDTTSEVHTILEKNIPVLNTKTYFYNSGRWGIGTPAGGTAGETAIRLNSGEYGNVANHPLFAGVTTTEGTIEMVSQADGKAMQPVADYEDTWTKSILAKVSGGTVIEEALSGNYLLISIGSGSFQYLTEDALKLFVNAVNYLTSTEKFVLTAPEVKSDKKEITSFKLNGIAGVIDAENHTIAVAYPELLGDITAIEPLIVISEYATITPEGAQDFTKPVEYTVTAQDGTTQVWTVTVTVSQLAQLQKTDMDYTSDMSTWENVPEWIFIKDGTLNKAYAGNDYTGSAIRMNKDGEVYFGLAVCSKITVTVSATGGRTFKLEVVGDDTKVVTKEGKSNTNYPLELVVNSESPVTVKLSTPGANGGATVQKVEVMYVEGGIGTALEDIQALDVNAPMYNVLGVEVDKAYKGIVIQNGKKYLLK